MGRRSPNSGPSFRRVRAQFAQGATPEPAHPFRSPPRAQRKGAANCHRFVETPPAPSRPPARLKSEPGTEFSVSSRHRDRSRRARRPRDRIRGQELAVRCARLAPRGGDRTTIGLPVAGHPLCPGHGSWSGRHNGPKMMHSTFSSKKISSYAASSSSAKQTRRTPVTARADYGDLAKTTIQPPRSPARQPSPRWPGS